MTEIAFNSQSMNYIIDKEINKVFPLVKYINL